MSTDPLPSIALQLLKVGLSTSRRSTGYLAIAWSHWPADALFVGIQLAKTDVYTHAEVSQQLPHPQIPKPSSLRGLEPITEPPGALCRHVPGKSIGKGHGMNNGLRALPALILVLCLFFPAAQLAPSQALA